MISDSVQQVKDTVKSVAEGQTVSEGSFTDLTALNKEKNAEAEASQETPEDVRDAGADKVEEFFDDGDL